MQLIQQRQLDLQAPAQRGRPHFLSAASGLVQVGEFLYVVADDENHLGVFTTDPHLQGQLVRLFEGSLPLELEARKASKPDMEALVLLPAFEDYPHGALLALGSGSKRKRQRGAVLELDKQGAIRHQPEVVDLTELYAELKKTFTDLNIEGAFVRGDCLYLLQRGNKSELAQNALITLSLKPILKALRKNNPLPAKALEHIQPYDLGSAEGIPLCFTDAAVLPDGSWIFSAAAEATDNSYQDGAIVGAAIGMINAQGAVCQLERLEAGIKVEGVSARVDGDTVHLLLVTDADDPTAPAQVLSGTLSCTKSKPD